MGSWHLRACRRWAVAEARAWHHLWCRRTRSCHPPTCACRASLLLEATTSASEPMARPNISTPKATTTQSTSHSTTLTGTMSPAAVSGGHLGGRLPNIVPILQEQLLGCILPKAPRQPLPCCMNCGRARVCIKLRAASRHASASPSPLSARLTVAQRGDGDGGEVEAEDVTLRRRHTRQFLRRQRGGAIGGVAAHQGRDVAEPAVVQALLDGDEVPAGRGRTAGGQAGASWRGVATCKAAQRGFSHRPLAPGLAPARPVQAILQGGRGGCTHQRQEKKCSMTKAE